MAIREHHVRVGVVDERGCDRSGRGTRPEQSGFGPLGGAGSEHLASVDRSAG
jgi:hypothetical protein